MIPLSTSIASVTKLIAVYCCACGRELTDAVSAEIGMGPDCRSVLNYDLDKLPSAELRIEANGIVHAIAGDVLTAIEVRGAIFRLHELGFQTLAKRIEQRKGRWIARQQAHVEEIIKPEAGPEPKPITLPFKLTEGQDRAREAVQQMMRVRGFGTLVVAGFAGTGKTTTLSVFAQEYGTPQVITPTGKAALRVREATGLYASTIHRWLYKPKEDEKTGAIKFVRRTPDDISIPPSRLILLDEASMVGPDVWKDVYETCKGLDLKLVLVGDGFQLPPVQAANAAPFSLLTPEFAVSIGAQRVEMTEVLRQAQGSPVIRASMELRNGGGLRALRELPRADYNMIANVAVTTHLNGGVTICHKNITRATVNAGIRGTLGIYDEMPRVGEPLLVVKNSYEAGVMNGETFNFEGWIAALDDGAPLVPEIFERVYDRWKQAEEDTRFGATTIGKQLKVTLSLEELHGRLSVGAKAIEISASRWSRLNNLYNSDTVTPHVHAQFGYSWTAHKSQGSAWPYVFVILEPSVRFDEDDGRRWVYTAITRAQKQAAYYIGRI